MQNLLAKIAAATTAATSPAAEPLVMVSGTINGVCLQASLPQADVSKALDWGDHIGQGCEERGFHSPAGSFKKGELEVEKFTWTQHPHHMHHGIQQDMDSKHDLFQTQNIGIKNIETKGSVTIAALMNLAAHAGEPTVLVSGIVNKVCLQATIPQTGVKKALEWGDKIGQGCKERGFGGAAGSFKMGETEVERFTWTQHHHPQPPPPPPAHHMHHGMIQQDMDSKHDLFQTQNVGVGSIKTKGNVMIKLQNLAAAAKPKVLVSGTVNGVCLQTSIPQADVSKVIAWGDHIGQGCEERGFGGAAGSFKMGETEVERFTWTQHHPQPHHMHHGMIQQDMDSTGDIFQTQNIGVKHIASDGAVNIF